MSYDLPLICLDVLVLLNCSICFSAFDTNSDGDGDNFVGLDENADA
jgi:hypothetical protein